jgi:hypothetical protein
MVTTKGRWVHREKTGSSMSPHTDDKPPTGTAICRECQAIWRRGTWSLDPTARRSLRGPSPATSVLCPACACAAQGHPSGIVYLTGSYLARNRIEILNLLRNLERAAASKNPLERIIRITHDASHPVVVETTSEKLARRLGRGLSKACGGRLAIRFSHEDKLVRIYWHRDVAEMTA